MIFKSSYYQQVTANMYKVDSEIIYKIIYYVDLFKTQIHPHQN